MADLTHLETIGRYWEKGEMRRLYFNTEVLADLIGFSFTRYGTGNISSASLHGSKLSNTKARRLLTELDLGKCWYDYNEDDFHTQGISSDHSVTILTKLRQLT